MQVCLFKVNWTFCFRNYSWNLSAYKTRRIYVTPESYLSDPGGMKNVSLGCCVLSLHSTV